MAKLSGRDKTVVVAVKDLEGLSDLFLGVGILHLAGHHGQELCWGIDVSFLVCTRAVQAGTGLTREVDSSVVVSIHLVDHVLELRLARVLAERAHDSAQLLGGDLTCATLLIRLGLVRREMESIGRIRERFIGS